MRASGKREREEKERGQGGEETELGQEGEKEPARNLTASCRVSLCPPASTQVACQGLAVIKRCAGRWWDEWVNKPRFFQPLTPGVRI